MYNMELGNPLPDITFVEGQTKSPAGTTIHDAFDPNDLSLYDNMSDFRLRNRQTNRETDAWGVQLDAIYRPEPGGFFESINFGVREGKYERITNNEDNRQWRVRDSNFLDEYWDGGYDGIEDDLFQAMIDECSYVPFPNSKFLNNAGGTNIGGSWATFDTLCATRLLTNGENALLAPDRTLNERDINVAENTTAAYAMANFYSENTPIPIWGNFGVRVVDTEVDSKGLRTRYYTGSYYNEDDDATYWYVRPEEDVLDEVRIKHTNTEWLPSANVNFEISDTFMIRAALYRAMSRYNIEFMGAGRSFDVEDWDDQEWSSAEEAIAQELNVGSGGNPEIEPFMSWNGDVSFEWYLSDDTAFSFAVYYKYFEAEVFPALFPEPVTVDDETIMTEIRRNVLTGNTSDLWGIEVTASHVLSNWRAPFDGLGFKVSWNHSDTDFETQDPIFGDQLQEDGSVLPGMNLLVPASLYGQSDDIANLHLFWDIGNLNLSAFWKYRSEYFQPNDGDPRVNRWFDDYTYIDLSATYRFNSVWKMRFTAQNITDEYQLADRGLRDGSPTLWNSSGTKYELGVTATWD
jgi:TonB-dependent receptor